jgi:DNA modification methylase
VGDALDLARQLPDESINCIVTSPPYWHKVDYGVEGQIGLEDLASYIARLVAVFAELLRALSRRGTCWVNIGDSFAGHSGSPGIQRFDRPGDRAGTKPSAAPFFRAPTPAGVHEGELVGVPWLFAFAMRQAGWRIRQEIVWHKLNGWPESMGGKPSRCTKAHEQLFMFTKAADGYHYDADAIREPHSPGSIRRAARGRSDHHKFVDGGPTRQTIGASLARACHPLGRNKRDVWPLAVARCSEAHFAVMPDALAEPCILAGCPTGGIVLDPFMGAGTVALVAERHGRAWLGFDLNPNNLDIFNRRLSGVQCGLRDVAP